jgi:hypothetical protein
MLLREKADQVQPLLRETGLDCWLIFVRETSLHPDPGFDLVVGADVVRNSAFLFGVNGERIALTAGRSPSLRRSSPCSRRRSGCGSANGSWPTSSTANSAVAAWSRRGVGVVSDR